LNPLKAHFASLIVVCSSFLFLAGTSFAQSSNSSTPQADHLDLTQVDRSLDPCTDFYQFACKKWIAKNPIPSDQVSWWLGTKLMLWDQAVVHNILDKTSADDPQRNPIQQKIGDFYASCMNESEINKKGLDPIKPELDRIDAIKDKKQLPEEIAHLHQITYTLTAATDSGAGTALFGFDSGQDLDNAAQVVATVDQGGLGLPDRNYYLKTDQKSADLRQQYLEHIKRTFLRLGEAEDQATSDAKTVMDLETSLAKVSMDIVKRRDPANLDHKLSEQELHALTPNFSWNEYLRSLGAPPTAHYLVMTPDFFKGVNQLIADVPLESWKTYLRWQLVNVSSSLLSESFATERFAFYGQAMRGQKVQSPRWRRCAQSVDRNLDQALGQEYVAQAFAGTSKQRMLQMVDALKAALNTDIQQSDWMSPETKKAAIAKLEQIADKIGYPDHWRDYSSLQIVRGDLLEDAYRSGAFGLKDQLAKIGKPLDRGQWNISISMPNAFYDPQQNSIIFPASILQPPLFDPQLSDPANFAAIGAIIGHELTHGFDDEGRKFDAAGNLKDWWTAQDAKEFESRAKCIADEYSGMDATDGVKLNGELTLGENTADNGGLRVAYMALENTLAKSPQSRADLDGFTPEQQFFVAYAETWCANSTPQYLRMAAQSDPHATPKARVNGVVSNMPEFQKAFGCKTGQPMVRENACRVW
jgi:putative endopeptidase